MHAARKFGDRVTYLATAAEMVPFAAASFDCVIMSEVLEHTSDERRALAEVWSVLKPGGMLILTVPRAGPLSILDLTNWKFRLRPLHRWLYGLKHQGDYTHFHPVTSFHRHYTLDRLAELSQPHFAIEQVRRTGFLVFALCADYAAFLNSHYAVALSWRLAAADYQRSYGPLSYNVALCARKVERPVA